MDVCEEVASMLPQTRSSCATVDIEDEDENYDESIGTLKRPGEDKPKGVRIFDTGPSTSPIITQLMDIPVLCTRALCDAFISPDLYSP